jgi:glycosyltransferase involved in cell wall biosynthesis
LQQFAYAWQLYKLKPDLVHFTLTPQQPFFYFGKQITFTHDLTMLKFTRAGRLPKWLHRLRMRGYRFLLWQSHRKAKRILTPTEYVRDAIHKYHMFTSRKLTVTLEASEPPISGKPVTPEALKPYIEKNPEFPFILYVGTAFPHKNLRRLVKSMEHILEKQAGIRLLLVGKQEYHSKKLEKFVQKRDYADRIIFTGYVSDAELKWLYEHAQCYVFPSLSEGFGLPGLEAMVHGCPVVSSDRTCLPEVYGDAARYFNPKDPEDIADAVLDVINNTRLRNKLIDNGHERAKQFSWKKMAQETLAVYNEIL